MDAAVSSPNRIRRLMPLILWSSGGLSVLGITAIILWLWLPRWAPEWVVKYSPWVDLVLRAVSLDIANSSKPPDGELLHEFNQRITGWSPSDHPAIVAGLESPDRNLRLVCVWAFTNSGARPSHPEHIQDKLVYLVLTDTDAEVRSHAYGALMTEKSPRMSEVRSQVMKEGEDWARYKAVRDLDSRTSDLDLQTLLSALREPDSYIPAEAARRVLELDETRAIPRLIEMVPWSEDGRRPVGEFRGEVDLVVLSALGHFKDVRALPALTGLLEELQSLGFPEAGDYVPDLLDAISKIDAEKGLHARLKILHGEKTPAYMRALVVQQLGGSANQNAIEPLINQLQDAEPLVLAQVVIALCRLKAFSAVEPILERLEARRSDLLNFETSLENYHPLIGLQRMTLRFSALTDQVATLGLSSVQRERLERLRKE